MSLSSPGLASSLLGAMAAWAFANAPIGSLIENVEMPTLEGARQPLLVSTQVNVFVFIKPGQEHSQAALRQIAQCERELAGKPVHWCAIVSDRIPRAEVEQAVKEAGIVMPVLVDTSNALYGKLGVVLHPVIGITDAEHKLLAYEPFLKVNYAEVFRARIRHALKEISDQELELVLHPPAAVQGGDDSVAVRYLNLARKQFEGGNYEKAAESLKKSLEKNPRLLAARLLRGRTLLAQNNHAAARTAYEEVLKMEPANAEALEGLKRCQP